MGEELGVGDAGKEGEGGKGLKEEEVDEQGDKGWGQIQSMKAEEKEVGSGEVLGKKQSTKDKKPKEKKKEKGKKDKEKSQEEETPKHQVQDLRKYSQGVNKNINLKLDVSVLSYEIKLKASSHSS